MSKGGVRELLHREVTIPGARGIKRTLQALAAGFANGVLQLILWVVLSIAVWSGGVDLGHARDAEHRMYDWMSAAFLALLLWWVVTTVWVLLLRALEVEDWKVLIGIPMLGASCVTLIILVLGMRPSGLQYYQKHDCRHFERLEPR